VNANAIVSDLHSYKLFNLLQCWADHSNSIAW